jgi:hypothetical protein
MYIDSGAGAVATNPHQSDLLFISSDWLLTTEYLEYPERRLVFREEVVPADAHGATLTTGQKYLWVADRGRNFIWVVDTETDQIVNRIFLVGSASPDPTPDLLAISPNGSHVYMSLRGPAPLTGDPHVSTGSTPGVGIIKVTEGGRDGIFETFARMSNIDSNGVERADAHALRLRLTQ